VVNNFYLNKMAKEAYRSYILAYNSHSMKDIFNIHHLDLQVQLSHYVTFCVIFHDFLVIHEYLKVDLGNFVFSFAIVHEYCS